MPTRPRVVLTGCGGIAEAWLGTTPVQKQVEIVGLVDINGAAAAGKAEQFELTKAATGTDLAAVLKKVQPDAVFDCSIPEAHCEVTLTALRHGCHVLGEKPMADTMPNARKMLRAAEKANKLYAIMQNRRYQPEIRRLRRFLDSGAIGKVTTVQSNFFIGAHFGGFRDEMQHVLILDMAIHSFDQARLITGQDAEAVYCHEWNPSGSWYKHGASAVATFEMTDEVVYTYQGSWCSEGCNTSWECDWHIIGEKGSVHWDGGDGFKCEVVQAKTGFIRKQRERQIPKACPKRLTGGHAGCIAEFIRCLRDDTAPETICSDNVKSLAMVHSAVRSANQKRRIAVTL
ncbi:MAG: Gfo/Idh/MocA family oxidoreductase [Verrucomicrobia bacterium]|jgi:predicted dehydrogenase|nr:Gfo/Idh/MocA family oxidoreductase [Verrucomicrobiota bacterium]